MTATSFFPDRSKWITAESLLNLSHLTKAEKNHLTKVYLTLAYTSLVTFLAVAIPGPWHHLPHFLGFVFFIGSFLYLSSQRYHAELTVKKVAALTLLCVGQAIIIKEFVLTIFYVHPEVIKTSLIYSFTIFVCFSLSSLYMQTRLWMYIGSLSASALSYMSLVLFFNRFFKSHLANDAMTILGLFVYAGFIIFDTQVTLEDFKGGQKDYILHAVSLYVDLVGLFIKLTKILYEKKESENRKKRTR